MDSSQLDQMLTKAHSEGHVDSSGVFEINPFTAARKLAQYQLADPCEFVLKWVQAAVAGGATWVRLRISSDEVAVSYDGTPLVLEQVGRLDRWLLDHKRPHLHHLAVGLNTLLGRDCDAVVVGSGEREVRVTPAGHTFGSASLSGNRISAHIRRGLGARLARREERAVLERCRYAPVPVLLNDRPVNRLHFGEATHPRFAGSRLDLGPQRARGQEAYFGSPEFSSRLLAAPALGATRWTTVADLQGSPELELPAAEAPGLVCDGLPVWACHAMCRRTARSWSEATFVGDGVVLCQLRNVLDRPGLQAIIAARDLTTDLSGFGLVHDEAYFKTIRYLRDRVLWMY